MTTVEEKENSIQIIKDMLEEHRKEMIKINNPFYGTSEELKNDYSIIIIFMLFFFTFFSLNTIIKKLSDIQDLIIVIFNTYKPKMSL